MTKEPWIKLPDLPTTDGLKVWLAVKHESTGNRSICIAHYCSDTEQFDISLGPRQHGTRATHWKPYTDPDLPET